MGFGQPGCIDGQKDVCRAVRSFILDSLQQLVFLAFDPVDLDAGLLGEIGVERFVRLVMAGGINENDYLFVA